MENKNKMLHQQTKITKKKQKQKSIAIYIDCQNFVYIKYLL